ncbi:major facilitator superfamily transporter 16 isoform X2 [Lycorma delicatula]|uniref:major facilitator superfamily transporter 16 isoform X2 n=1 Tax=Lycorma delicatula TaxID=130591 RepID=UPI003F50E129
MSSQVRDVPIGIKVIQKVTEKCCRTTYFNRNLWYRSSVWILTFLAYMSYHATRKTISVVKTTLNRNCSELTPPPGINGSNSYWCDWAPFDGPDATRLLGALDSSFLFAYAGAMFISGIVAERVSLRYFLALGMIFSGVACYLLGIAKTYNIHSLLYFILVQIFGGIVQTTGWPGVVAVMGNWFEKEKRGLIFGIWNSHTSIGNIIGSLIASYYLEIDWSLSFIMPGLLMACIGFLNFLFLVSNPSDVGCTQPNRPSQRDKNKIKNQTVKCSTNNLSVSNFNDSSLSCHYIKNSHHTGGPLASASTSLSSISSSSSPSSKKQIVNVNKSVSTTSATNIREGQNYVYVQEDNKRAGNEVRPILADGSPNKAVGFFGALCIPGVVEFSLCLFFAKLVSYTFLYWLPLYIKASTPLSATLSADLSTLFDVGGIIGGIAAGMISDYSGMNATTCSGMLLLAIPVLFVYHMYGADNLILNTLLLLLTGILVNGPYALITTAVSAELGTHHSLAGNSKALATVTAIIDGTGSIGAAVGPLLAGLVSGASWQYVFYMLMLSDLFALLLLARLVTHEFKRLRSVTYPTWSP